jgi:hypothetical protein
MKATNVSALSRGRSQYGFSPMITVLPVVLSNLPSMLAVFAEVEAITCTPAGKLKAGRVLAKLDL